MKPWRTFLHLAMAATVCVALVAASPTPQVKPDTLSRSARVRSGAGAFHKQVALLPAKTAVEIHEKKGVWVRISAGAIRGWVTRNVLASTSSRYGKSRRRGLGGLRDAKPLVNADPSVVVAATKGAFPSRYAEKHGANPRAVEALDAVPFTADEYSRFEDAITRNHDRIDAAIEFLGDVEAPPPLDPQFEQLLGRAIAARLAGRGLVRSVPLTAYLNMVAARVGEYSERSGLRYKVLVLATDEPGAFATPGGYIFMTRGLLSLIEDEAELAGILGHEIAHVARLHGITAYKRAAIKARVDDAFSELDTAIVESGGTVATIEDLENLADQYYDAIANGRSRKSERHADVLGVAYAYYAGYDPGALERVFLRLKARSHEAYSTRAEDTTHLPLSKRLEILGGFRRAAGIRKSDKQQSRFRRRMGSLR